ncbi:hypothetical protein DGG96_10240 [Legionella qingyii]|uniref:Uncharacterized protein n=1 Tax=Legionella qingyii TaxID=2184757 RepID=A0A317U363_9GAMM|nr:hypothetical protein [Legionella qingyii]PWY55665.1 hypothetical protein DGG96_10240 [Legionella qingyii]RUR21667.1 hypothetical protein ELY20_11975 [Legionella qingyii]RUR25065.1 hypothetical protein ELY16_10395 [Legionella qingyii]
MYWKNEKKWEDIRFDIYPKMSPVEAKRLISQNFDLMDTQERRRIDTQEARLWLLRLSSESDQGVLVIETMRWQRSKKQWENETIAMRLTKDGWQPYATPYNKDDVLPITKDNLNAHVPELQTELKKQYLSPQNMIYPELHSELLNKDKIALPDGHPHKFIEPCLEMNKGILRRGRND